MARKRKKELTLVAGDKPQLRQKAPRDWSKAKSEAFLRALAETCNVSEACRQSGVSVSAAYARRKVDAPFRAGWIDALGEAYQRLEMVLLDRAFNGTEKLLTRKDGSEERMREYSNQLGLTLLKMHRDSAVAADREFSPEQVDELRERLLNKFRRLKQRDDKDKEESA